MARSTTAVRTRLAPRATLLGILLAGILVLGGLLAREAHRASRSHARTARRAQQGAAAVAAFEFQRGVEDELDAAAGYALAPITAARAASPYEALPGPEALDASFGNALACPRGGNVARRLVRVDLRDGSLRVHGPALRAADARWIADTLASHAAGFQPGRRDAVILGSNAQEHLALVYGVRFASYGAPLAAYALVTCPAALGAPLFERVLARRALIPAATRSGAANTALLAVAVRDRHGHPMWRSFGPPDDTTDVFAEATIERAGGVVVRATLRPAAARAIGGEEAAPPMRPGLLLGLLAATTALAAVAVVQLRREEELARLRADFTSSVSHELRTPLAQILLFGETLALDRVRGPADRRLAAETIVQEARRLMHMVDNVLHFARSQRGMVGVESRPVPLVPQVRSIVAAFAPVAEGVTLREALDDPVTAVVDPGALRQILLNLLDNAVKYGPAGQTVTVGVEAVGGRARLWVDDQGPGIPPADRERIWHAYVRLPRHQGAARGGSGIGLAVVRELAGQLGGAAWVEEAPGGGARFVVELPLANEPDEEHVEAVRAAPVPGGHAGSHS